MVKTYPILVKKYLFLLLSFSSLSQAETASYNECLTLAIQAADDSLTIGELKQQCQEPSAKLDQKTGLINHQSAIKLRQQYEKQAGWNAFSLMPHKPNYIILSYNSSQPNAEPLETAFPNHNTDLQHLETKFQLSMKFPIMQNVIYGHGDLYAAYTNRSFWQQFNKTHSSPFRDTNHEAETWLSFDTNYSIAGFQGSIIRTGFSHQSNGRSGSLSRSWNRLYSEFILEQDDLYLSFKPWFRIPESSSSDDNADIDHFMGHFELRALYKHKEHTFDLMLRNNLKTGHNRGALELAWSFPIHKKVRGYVQWFNGYGESLLDYDNHTNSIGFGVQLSDWL